MSKMSLPSLIAAALLGLPAGAQAADLPARPVHKAPPAAAAPARDWSGIYIGAQVGYGWGQSSGTQNADGTFFPVVPYTLDPGGVLAGGHIGFNYQVGAFVVGGEADIEASNLHGDTTISAFDQTYFFNVKANTLASVRGRIGWAHDALMLYGTGGVAWGHVTTPPLDTLNGWRTAGRSEPAPSVRSRAIGRPGPNIATPIWGELVLSTPTSTPPTTTSSAFTRCDSA